ncbi:protein-methionine-sulfoxide reductase catalytic subunit MsrP [Glaciecola sp. KUL10]|uniref:protein-methionine-sulfoxide reductase catalytic subunit MsrP n=1 Tax=Glaciecola sp. (strain KUL10) TaxID=2161813 RepID=UPI000D78C90F|nr:protein-methionine-sulfoxide reductase catalytic subunit MsrP [Glaciecola sp. KUL10]GBL03025.1 oxidoreductase molybdopterin binding protein [Glaciecola sp. KUL10]
MLIKSTKRSDESENQVTDETVFNSRRDVLKKLGFLGAGSLLGGSALANPLDWFKDERPPKFVQSELSFNVDTSTKQTLTPESQAINYNNFYEFGTSKSDPAKHAQSFKVNPWKLEVEGLVENPLTLDYDDLLTKFPLEERIYRLRCVEAWSMVIPWIGFSLSRLLKQAKPLSSAKYVAFETVYDPKQMRGQRSRFLGGGVDYPYIEGLRLDEAMHPLALMTVGMYGKTLPPQNGAPVRLTVPWKYGFKSIKSLVKIKLVDKMPPTSWNILIPSEYGFYANVNPKVAHPRWSQARERRIVGASVLDQKRIDTKMFNGYEEVTSLYTGMDLARYY